VRTAPSICGGFVIGTALLVRSATDTLLIVGLHPEMAGVRINSIHVRKKPIPPKTHAIFAFFANLILDPVSQPVHICCEDCETAKLVNISLDCPHPLIGLPCLYPLKRLRSLRSLLSLRCLRKTFMGTRSVPLPVGCRTPITYTPALRLNSCISTTLFSNRASSAAKAIR